MKKITLSLCMLFAALVMVGCTPNNTANGTDTTTTEPVGEQSELAKLASCITEAGVTMYGTNRCSHCQNQKAMFGDAFENIDFVDCDLQKPACVAAGVQGFPTWRDAGGTNYPGVQSLENLASIAGCEMM